MARLTAPLLSLGASGTIAKALVFSSWKGIPYARVHVIPANPKSDAQVEVRNVFKTLNSLWNRMPADGRSPWHTATRGLPLTDRNLLIKTNVPLLIDEITLAEFVFSVGHGAALPPTSVAITTPTAAQIDYVFVPPTAPDGYTLTHCVGGAIPAGIPGDAIVRRMYNHAHAAPDYDFAMSVGAAGLYSCAGWLRWVRNADGAIFHSSDISTIVTVT